MQFSVKRKHQSKNPKVDKIFDIFEFGVWDFLWVLSLEVGILPGN